MTLDNLVRAIKEKTRIEDLISQYTELTEDGDRLVGNCPFPHGGTPDAPEFENTGSFTVYPHKQDLYCYGCHKGDSKLPDLWGRKQYGSDVIAFWREIRRQQTGQEDSFQDAVVSLARHLGLGDLIPDEKEGSATAEILRVQGQRALNWHGYLQRAQHVRRYLTGRGVSNDVIDKFTLGYVIDAGKENFRHRVSIPIRHAYSGRVLAFSFRTLDPDGAPKYMHSATSAVWRAGDNLFGLHEASQAISKRGYAIVTEDFFGPLVLASAGITNAVGVMGVSIRENQAKILRRHTDTLYWWMEDAAGYRGLMSMAPMLLQLGFRLFVIDAEMDADDFCLQLNMQPDTIKERIPALSRYAPQWLVQQQARAVQSGELSEDRALEKLAALLRACTKGSDRALMGREIRQSFAVDPVLLLEVL